MAEKKQIISENSGSETVIRPTVTKRIRNAILSGRAVGTGFASPFIVILCEL